MLTPPDHRYGQQAYNRPVPYYINSDRLHYSSGARHGVATILLSTIVIVLFGIFIMAMITPYKSASLLPDDIFNKVMVSDSESSEIQRPTISSSTTMPTENLPIYVFTSSIVTTTEENYFQEHPCTSYLLPVPSKVPETESTCPPTTESSKVFGSTNTTKTTTTTTTFTTTTTTKPTTYITQPSYTQATSITSCQNLSELQRLVVEETNKERRRYGLDELIYGNEIMQTAADIRASESAKLFSHTRPDNTIFSSIIKNLNINYQQVGENLLRSNDSSITATRMVEMWMTSESHKENILNSNYKYINIGVYYHDGYVYVVQHFYDLL